ncbi:hypothetical protein [Acidaminococcus sp. LBK-2]
MSAVNCQRSAADGRNPAAGSFEGEKRSSTQLNLLPVTPTKTA